jgi:hypothetical protein
MAKALFHKSQRVFVKPVGTWAVIERVVPQWVKDVDEPLRISYDCGLGRQFQAQELVSEQAMHNHDRTDDDEDDMLLEHWQIRRRTAKWRAGFNGAGSGNLGTFPMVITDEGNWSGWRVAGNEYDRDPQRIEHQARMIVQTPDLLRIARKMAEYASDNPDTIPSALKPIAQRCAGVLRSVYQLEDEQKTEAAE